LVVESWENDWLSGYDVDVPGLFATATEGELAVPSIVVLSNITVFTLCPHHLLPAEGSATVAYLPGTKLLGIGSLARLVHAFSRRFILQEQIGTSVVQALMTLGDAKGAYCRLDMRHGCLRLRGAKEPSGIVTTSCLAGVFETAEGRQQLDTTLAQGPAQ
jgi:GTP cyclohydrolase I